MDDDRVPILAGEVDDLFDDSSPRTDPDDDPATGSTWCHPDRKGHKVIALVLMCLLGFGSYFCFDNPGALQNEIKSTMSVSTFTFTKLYSWYSWPNVFLPVIGGYLIDTCLGIRLGAGVFAFILIIGQGVFALGAFVNSFSVMEFGRFIFGMGGESLAVAQNTYASAWFSGKALNMVFGLQLSVARVGSTVNFQVVGPIFHALMDGGMSDKNKALGITILLAGIACVISFIAALILGWMDLRAEPLRKKVTPVPDPVNNDIVHMRDVFSLPFRFWVLCIICVAYYVAIFPFVSLGQVFFMKKYVMLGAQANFINGLIYLISAFASPAFGFLIDRTGRNVTYVFVSVLATLIGHILMGFSFVNPYVAIILIGLSYSMLASALWPLCTFIVTEKQQATAFGIMQAVQNLGLATITLASGLIVDQHGYIWLEVFFMSWVVLALVMTMLLWICDYCGDGFLNMTIQERHEYKEAVKRLNIVKFDQPE